MSHPASSESLPYRHLCASSQCDCGITRRDWLRIAALAGAAATPLLRAGDARAQSFKGDDVPVRIGYLPITDATPMLVAHARGFFEAEGLRAEKPRMFRSWSQMVEAFIAGQINMVHLLSPTTLFVRYGSKFPAKVVAWNHVNGSALVVAPEINGIQDFGGRTVAIPYWYSIHNIVLQMLIREAGLTPVARPRNAPLTAREVNLVVVPPAEMVSALAAKSVAGYIVAEPFVAAGEALKVAKVLRFIGDVWKNHACCLATLAERDIAERPEWAQRVTTALVKAQLWTRNNQLDTAKLLSSTGEGRYMPQPLPVLSKVLAATDYGDYEKAGVVRNKGWYQRRIDFQPYPFPSYTEALVRALQTTHVEGDATFLKQLDPAFVARDLVDDRFVRKALAEVGGMPAFGLPAGFSRTETIVAG